MTLGYGESIGARASTNAVMKEVIKADFFENALTNEFDAKVYEDLLARNNLTPREYEQDIRDQLTGTYVIEAMGASIEPPSVLADLQTKFQGEIRTVSILRIDADDVSDLPDPNEEDLKSYFEQNKAAFGEPERRGITVLHFSPQDFRTTEEITEDMLVNAYEAGKQRKYSTDETRRFVEAFFETEADALQALGILAAGGAPDTLENVSSISEQTAREANIANAEFAEDLFSLPAGAVTQPSATNDQWLIARVEEVIPGTPFPFEDVRDLVRSDLAAELAQRRFETAGRNLEDLKGEGLTLQEIGERIGAPAISYTPVDQRGGTASGGLLIDLLANYPDALVGVSELFEGEIIDDRFDLPDGGIYLAQLDRIVPANTPDFEAVRDRVLAAWKISNRGEAVALFSENLSQRINAGETTLEAEARNLSKPILRPTDGFRRSGQNPDLPPAAVTAVFAANSAGTVVATPSQQQGEYLLVSVDSISPPSEDVATLFGPQIRSLLVQDLGGDLDRAFGPELGEAIEFSANYGEFSGYKARNASQ